MPLHGALPGDVPPPPPLTMFSNFLQLNAKYGVSPPRAVELLNFSSDNRWRLIDKYLVCTCGFKGRDLPTFKWCFFMHLAGVITRHEFWDVHSIYDAINL